MDGEPGERPPGKEKAKQDQHGREVDALVDRTRAVIEHTRRVIEESKERLRRRLPHPGEDGGEEKK
jgi:hypothetical protein